MTDIIQHLFTPLTEAGWVVVLAILRVLSATTALLALRDVRQHWRLNRVPALILMSGLLLLSVAQMLGAIGLQQPAAPLTTIWSLLANGSTVLVCVGIYLRGVLQIRRPS